jgi:uncharacterized protein (DUF952 family)
MRENLRSDRKPDAAVFHITDRAAWNEALSRGEYRAPSLETQGFIHASTRDQVVETADRFYRGRGGLVLLCIDTSRLRADLRYEPPDMPGRDEGTSGLFPHLYGPLNLDAVSRIIDLPPGADGRFALPPEA